MPNIPQPFQLMDWREKARAYDRFVFDLHAQGEFLPLAWLDDSRINIDRPTFGLPSYVGAVDQGSERPNSQEGITCMGAVLGATLVGLDKSGPDHDYVAMCEAWFNTRNGIQLVLNRQEDSGGGSFWYEPSPHRLLRFGRSLSRPSTVERHRTRDSRSLAAGVPRPDPRRWTAELRPHVVQFPHAAERRQREVARARCRGGRRVAGIRRVDEVPRCDASGGCGSCVRFLQQCPTNPYYEVLLPFGALTAARMNAELGREYNVERLLNWCFGISDCRGGGVSSSGTGVDTIRRPGGEHRQSRRLRLHDEHLRASRHARAAGPL